MASRFGVFFFATMTYLAKGPLNNSLNFIFPTKYVIPKSLVRLACEQLSQKNHPELVWVPTSHKHTGGVNFCVDIFGTWNFVAEV